jgi:hypothetical protein
MQLKGAVMAAKYLSSLPSLNNVAHIPGYQSFATDLLDVSRASSAAAWMQLVSEAQRPAFEAAAASAAARLDPSGALRARVVADGIRSIAPDTPRGTLPTRFIRAPPAPLHVAIWANAPRNTSDAWFLFDAFSEPLRRAALQRMLDTGAPAMTDILSNTFTAVGPASIIFTPAWPFADANVTYSVTLPPQARRRRRRRRVVVAWPRC